MDQALKDEIERRPAFDELLAVADATVELMEASHGRTQTQAAAISALFIARARQAVQSCAILASRGLTADAWSVARTVVELDIEHAYIMAATDPLDTFEQYAFFDAVNDAKLVRAIAALHPDGVIDPAHLAMASARAKEAIAKAGDDRSWAGPGMNLRERAIATERTHFYDLVYREACGASHGGFASLRYVLPQGTDWPLKIQVGRGALDGRPLALALPSACLTIAVAARAAEDLGLLELANALVDRSKVAGAKDV